MDSSLDIKFKNLMNEYYPNKDEKLNPIYFSNPSKPFLFKKKKLKKPKSHILLPINNVNKPKNKSSTNIIYIKLKSAQKRDNKNIIKLKPFKPVPLSINHSEKRMNDRTINRDKILVSTDILQDKTFFKLGTGRLSINSLFNQIQENKNKKNEYIKKNISDIELNKLHNLQLTPSKEKKFLKKMTKFAMLNNLYHKYSSTSSGNIPNKNEENNNNDKYYIKENKKELFKSNSLVYLTYYDPNKNFNFNNIYKRNLNLMGNHIKNNIIIDKDRKIYIDCLMSKVDSDINAKKIFPKNFGKTIYNLQKENSYIRIQNLDNIFSEIMKK